MHFFQQLLLLKGKSVFDTLPKGDPVSSIYKVHNVPLTLDRYMALVKSWWIQKWTLTKCQSVLEQLLTKCQLILLANNLPNVFFPPLWKFQFGPSDPPIPPGGVWIFPGAAQHWSMYMQRWTIGELSSTKYLLMYSILTAMETKISTIATKKTCPKNFLRVPSFHHMPASLFETSMATLSIGLTLMLPLSINDNRSLEISLIYRSMSINCY